MSELPLDGDTEGPYEHAMFWRDDGSLLETCVDAQRICFGYQESNRAIGLRQARYGTRYTRAKCEHCGSWHLWRVA